MKPDLDKSRALGRERVANGVSAGMRMLTFGYLTLGECTPATIVDAAAEAGFRSVGLRVEARRRQEEFAHRAVRNPSAMRAIKRRLAATGVSVSNVCGGYLVPDTTSDAIEALVDTGAELGCRYILANGDDPDESRTIANLACMCEFATSAGIKIAVEFVPYQVISSLGQAYRMVQATGYANAGLLPDPLHLSRSGGTPADLAAIDPARIFYAQICDAPAQKPATLEGCLQEARTGRLYPGQGGLPLVEYVRALPDECEIEVEVANAADLSLTPTERARKVGDALRAFMDGMLQPAEGAVG